MAEQRQRVIVIDENLDPEFAVQLKLRGRRATSIVKERLEGTRDKDLLKKLARRFDDVVLVTADRDIPKELQDLMKTLKPTIAFISSGKVEGMGKQLLRCDLVHRWAHRFQSQAPGTLMVYTPRGGARWTWVSRGKAPKTPGYRTPRLR